MMDIVDRYHNVSAFGYGDPIDNNIFGTFTEGSVVLGNEMMKCELKYV